MRKTFWLCLIAFFLIGVDAGVFADEEPAKKYYKVQTHLHTNLSGDCKTPAEDVVKWYSEHGFDFIVFTDHNRFCETVGKEIKTAVGIELTSGGRFIEGGYEVKSMLHMNALFCDPQKKVEIPKTPPPAKNRVEMLTIMLKLAKDSGGLPVLNHPNFYWSIDEKTLEGIAKAGVRHFEVLNAAIGGSNYGDAMHISHEALWDRILSKGILLYGTATDDTHHYYDADTLRKQGKNPEVGNRAWIMVLAEECSEKAIRAAIEKGDFYCSNGVTLKKYAATDKEITVEVEPEKPMKYTIEFIGQNGKVLQKDKKNSATYKITGKEQYVRVRITDTQKRVALTQPVFFKKDESSGNAEESQEKNAPPEQDDNSKPAEIQDNK